MSSNGSKKNPFPRLGSWEGSWEVGRRTKDVDECEKCQNNTHIAEISEKINFYSNRSRKEKWICREASGLLSVNKNEKNTAEHLIIYKLTSGPIYTYVLYYTNIDRLGNQGRVGGVGPRSKKILPIKYIYFVFEELFKIYEYYYRYNMKWTLRHTIDARAKEEAKDEEGWNSGETRTVESVE